MLHNMHPNGDDEIMFFFYKNHDDDQTFQIPQDNYTRQHKYGFRCRNENLNSLTILTKIKLYLFSKLDALVK